jgi:hypothetical protein
MLRVLHWAVRRLLYQQLNQELGAVVTDQIELEVRAV